MVITEQKRRQTVSVDLNADPSTISLDEALLAVRHLCREMSPIQAAEAERGEGFKGEHVKPYADRVKQLLQQREPQASCTTA
jgi:hypothetical protein